VEQLAGVEHLGLQLERRLVELRQVAQGLHQAPGVAGVAQRHLDQAAVVLAGGIAGPARFQRLEAGRHGRQRRAPVVREGAAGFAKVLPTTCRPPSFSRRWWATRYRYPATDPSLRMTARRTGLAAMTASASMRSGSSPIT